METKDYVIGIVGLCVAISLLLGIPYGTYRYGRFAERRLLTGIFVQMTQDTYYDGYRDGFKSGKAYVEQQDNEDGRY